MSQEQTAYPLSWPLGWKRNASRQHSKFGKPDYTSGRSWKYPSTHAAREFVAAELKRLKAINVVVSTNQQLNRFGDPRSDRREPDDPGAAVYFELGGKRKVLACDKYSTVGENLYAIGLTIEATRGIERWGSVTTEQAFAGYVALNEKTERSCWEVLGIHEHNIKAVRDPELFILHHFRIKARAAHPDNTNGSSEAFSEVVRAKDMALQLIRQ